MFKRKHKATQVVIPKKNLVDVAYSVIDTYYRKSQDIESLKKAKAAELKLILEGVRNQITYILKKNQGQPRAVIEEKVKELVKKISDTMERIISG